MHFELTHARQVPVNCISDGLFVCMAPSLRAKEKLHVVNEIDADTTIEFSGPEPICGRELRVLLGLVGFAGLSGRPLLPSTTTPEGIKLLTALDRRGEAFYSEFVVVQTSFQRLAREVGYKNTKDAKSLREAIERLWKVSIIIERKGRRQGFRLLAEYASETDRSGGQLLVALNPLIAYSLIRGNRHIRINLDEVRRLQSDAALILHHRLCGWINEGKEGSVSLNTVLGYLYGKDKCLVGAGTIRRRRQAARLALKELAGIGWTITEYASGKYKIHRPKPTS